MTKGLIDQERTGEQADARTAVHPIASRLATLLPPPSSRGAEKSFGSPLSRYGSEVFREKGASGLSLTSRRVTRQCSIGPVKLHRDGGCDRPEPFSA